MPQGGATTTRYARPNGRIPAALQPLRRLRARLPYGTLSHQVIALAAIGSLAWPLLCRFGWPSSRKLVGELSDLREADLARALAQPPSGETFMISYLSSSDSKISKPSGGRGLARLAAACAARSSSVSQRS